ncbi:B- and T-lymphocyte attenuator-like [Arapaima gigas]
MCYLHTAKEDDCVMQVRVARNIVVAAVEKTTTSVRCPFEPCGRKTEVSWCKIDNTAHCRRINTSDCIRIELMKEGKDTYLNVSLLIFTRFTLEDPGLYRCELSTDGKNMSIVSHNINVSISRPNGHHVTVSPGESTTKKCEPRLSVCQSCVLCASVEDVVTMSCRVQDGKWVTVSWCRQQGSVCTPLESGLKHSIMWVQSEPGSGISYLTFNNVSHWDMGTYHCRASAVKPCSPQTLLSHPLQLIVSGKQEPVAKTCFSENRPSTVNEVFPTTMNMVQIILITGLLGSSALMAIYWKLKSSGKKTPLCCPPEQVTSTDPPRRGNGQQTECDNQVEDSGQMHRLSSDYDDCV